MDDDAALWGLDPALLDSALPEIEDFDVWQDNVDALNVFLRLSTQWKVAGMGGFTGLDYLALEAVLRLTNTSSTPELFDDIQEMERAALPILNQRGQ